MRRNTAVVGGGGSEGGGGIGEGGGSKGGGMGDGGEMKKEKEKEKEREGKKEPKWTAMDIMTAYADRNGWVTAKAGRLDVNRAGNASKPSPHSPSHFSNVRCAGY